MDAAELLEELRAWGLRLPGAHRKSPWPEHDDLAVNDKTFAYLPKRGEPFSLSCKLPYTGSAALDLPYAETDRLRPRQERLGQLQPRLPTVAAARQLKEWVEESYRAQAPRKLVKELDAASR